MLTQTQLSIDLGISARQIRNYVKLGMPVIGNKRPYKYDADECRAWREKYLEFSKSKKSSKAYLETETYPDKSIFNYLPPYLMRVADYAARIGRTSSDVHGMMSSGIISRYTFFGKPVVNIEEADNGIRIHKAKKWLNKFKKKKIKQKVKQGNASLNEAIPEWPNNFCQIEIICKSCNKSRHQGFFFRVSRAKNSGVSKNRTCLVCEGYRKQKGVKTFQEYEKQREQAHEDLLLEAKGLYRCRRCDYVFDISLKRSNKYWCKRCLKEERSKDAVRERFDRWGVNSEDEYEEVVKSKSIESERTKRIIALTMRSTPYKQWSSWAYKHWVDNASDSEFYSVFDFTNKPWLNPRLSNTEKYRLRYKLDVEFNIKEKLRRQLSKQSKKDGVGDLMRFALKRNGNSPRVELLLGYSISELKEHLENQFNDGMCWDAFYKGLIHIDHIKPQRLFDMTVKAEWKKCWALSNLQPLWAEDNLKKSGKYEEA